MKQIKEALAAAWAWLRTDGLLHVETSALIIVFVQKLFGLLVAIVLGFAKEVYDRVSGNGTPEWHDLICDLIGIIIGLLIWSLPWW